MNALTRLSVVAAFGSLLAAPAVNAQATGPRLAYINSQAIMAQAPGRAEAEATFQKEMTSVQTQLQQLEDSLRNMFQNYQKERPTLDSATRERRETTLGQQEEALSKRAQELQQQAQMRQRELLEPILEQISDVVDEIREQSNYAMIFDVASQSSVVVSADKNLDVTEKVIARLKQLGPPKAAAKPASQVPVGPVQRPAGTTNR